MLDRTNEIDKIAMFFGAFGGNSARSVDDGLDVLERYPIADPKLHLWFQYKANCEADFKVGEINNGEIKSFFYGEIYNFQELCDSLAIANDKRRFLSVSNLVCHLYEKYGLEFATHLNGFFSVLLRDAKNDMFLILVDRFGSARPVFYHLSDTLIFSNKLSTLLADNKIDKDINLDALCLFLKYSYIPSPRTIIKRIDKLGPGEMIMYQKGQWQKRRYVDFEIATKLIADEKEAVDQYVEILGNSISKKLQTRKGQKMGIFLSGGLDTSANVALAAKKSQNNLITLGVGFADPDIDERPYAHIVANHCGLPFIDYTFDGSEIEDLPRIIWHCEEPFLENGLFLTYAAYKLAKDNADFVIAGNGADQLFGTGGFTKARPIAIRYLIDRLHLHMFFQMLKGATNLAPFNKDNILFKMKVMLNRCTDFNDWFFWGFDFYQLRKLLKAPVLKSSLNIFSNSLDGVSISLPEAYNFSLIHQDIEHYVCQNVLVKSNRLADMFGIVPREAYLDNTVVDFVLSLDVSLKRQGKLFDYLKGTTKTKYTHRLAMQQLLPPEVLGKPKQGGHVPMTFLLRDEQRRKKIYRYLLRSKILNELMNIGVVKNLLQEYESFVQTPQQWRNYHYQDTKANQILYLLTFCLWYEIFINQKFKCEPDYTLSQLIEI